MTVDRRQFLIRSAGAAVGTHGGPLALDGPAQVPRVADPAARLPTVAFEGRHQAGILTPSPPAACFAGADVLVQGREELARLLQTITGAARFLTAGGRPPAVAPGSPPADSGTLGPVVVPDGLTVTLGVGTSLFDGRFGLRRRRPAGLFEMRSFPGDSLDPAQCGGDLMLSICAGSRDTVVHALREITRRTGPAMRVRWLVNGVQAPSRPVGVPRNHQGFRDGIANPAVGRRDVAARLLWLGGGDGDQAWTAGGTLHVCRVIRIFTGPWDELALARQEAIIGRRRASGAPLGGRHETDIPDYAADPDGRVIPLRAHIRLANPRTDATENSRILRRGYNYDRGIDARGQLDLGLVFNCYQRDIRRQFEAVQ
ncbi:MAG: Dyp-type peroxidase, partial [Actinocrinis sp.]